MKRVALTFIGKDRPGIIARISKSLCQTGCNIEDTTMTILEGEFAMILIATIANDSATARLRKDFDILKKRWGLNCFWDSLPGNMVRGEKHLPGSKTYIVSVIGKDRTGIVFETSRILAGAGLNITDLNSKILGKDKRAVFAMILEFDTPKGFNVKCLNPAWERLRKKLKVDISMKPLDRLSL